MDNINKIIIDCLRISEDEIKPELSMKDVERWDSLTHMDLITSLEEELDLRFEMDEIMRMNTIESIYNIINSKK